MLDKQPPASWDALAKALEVVDASSIQKAISIQLQHQPSQEVYNFLHQTLNLCTRQIGKYPYDERGWQPK